MSLTEAELGDEFVADGKSLYDRCPGVGSIGNISTRLDGGTLRAGFSPSIARLHGAKVEKVRCQFPPLYLWALRPLPVASSSFR